MLHLQVKEILYVFVHFLQYEVILKALEWFLIVYHYSIRGSCYVDAYVDNIAKNLSISVFAVSEMKVQKEKCLTMVQSTRRMMQNNTL